MSDEEKETAIENDAKISLLKSEAEKHFKINSNHTCEVKLVA